MIGSLKKKNNLASMIRGKAIEEAIRFAFAIHRNHMSIPAAQNYANDIYYLRTKNLPTTVIKNNAKPINSLVRAGIKAFTFLKIKNLKNNDPYKINKSRYIYPDFKAKKIKLDGQKYENCCVELKVSGENIEESKNKHIRQCINYSIKSRKPVVLIYLIFKKNNGNFISFSSKPIFFLIKKKVVQFLKKSTYVYKG